MYYSFLLLHSWNRWLVLAFGVIAVINSFYKWQSNAGYLRGDNFASAGFIGSLHLQLVLGLALYLFFSPFTTAALQDMGEAMKHKELRYWGVEHIFGMVNAVVIAQIGRTSGKKSLSDDKRFKKEFFYYCTAMVIILGTVYFASRPWFRM